MTHEAHRVVAMIVGQDENNVSRLGFRYALDGQLVLSNRLAKSGPAKRHGKKNSNAHNCKKGNVCNRQTGWVVWLYRLAL